MINEDNSSQIRSGRSSRYPSINLQFAEKVISGARVFGRKITNNHIAGKGQPKGGAFIRKKASLGYYSLISGRGNDLLVTDLAESILYPSNNDEKRNALQEAFLSPQLFNRLYSEMEKDTPIDLEVIGNLIVRQYGIAPTAKKEFLSTFISSGIYVGLIEYSDDKKNILLKEKSNQKDSLIRQAPAEEENKGPLSTIKELYTPNDLQKIEITLEEGKAFIIVPKKLSSVDIKKLIAQIKILGNEFE